MSGAWSQLQTTVGETSQGPWVRWAVISSEIWNSTDTTLISQRDHSDTEGDCAKVETVGESTDVSESAREGTKSCRAEEEDGTKERDGEEEGVGQEWRKTEESVFQQPKRQASVITAQEKQESPSEREAC